MAFSSTVLLVKLERDRNSVSTLGRRGQRDRAVESSGLQAGPFGGSGLWLKQRVLDWTKRQKAVVVFQGVRGRGRAEPGTGSEGESVRLQRHRLSGCAGRSRLGYLGR